MPLALLAALCIVLIGATSASGAASDSSDQLAALDGDMSIQGGQGFAKKQGPLAAEGLSPRLIELSSARLQDAGKRAQAEAIGLPANGAGSLQRSGGKIAVQARVSDTSDSVRDAITGTGAEIL